MTETMLYSPLLMCNSQFLLTVLEFFKPVLKGFAE